MVTITIHYYDYYTSARSVGAHKWIDFIVEITVEYLYSFIGIVPFQLNLTHATSGGATITRQWQRLRWRWHPEEE